MYTITAFGGSLITWKDREHTRRIILHDSHTSEDVETATDFLRFNGRKLGLLDIGYHYIIERDGTLVEGRSREKIGSHAPGLNMDSIGICLVGGLDDEGEPKDNFTFSQRQTLFDLIHDLKDTWPSIEIKAHTELAKYIHREAKCPPIDMDELRHDYAIYEATGVIL